ncbi:MAG: DUF2024 family protein [Rhodothermales bacterium]
MKIAVWDTYVTKQDGNIMHFDILVEEGVVWEDVQKHGKQYLAAKAPGFKALTTAECTFCHIEEASDDLKKIINTQGYSIIEMEGC